MQFFLIMPYFVVKRFFFTFYLILVPILSLPLLTPAVLPNPPPPTVCHCFFYTKSMRCLSSTCLALVSPDSSRPWCLFWKHKPFSFMQKNLHRNFCFGVITALYTIIHTCKGVAQFTLPSTHFVFSVKVNELCKFDGI